MRLDPLRSFSKDIDRLPDERIPRRLMQVLLTVEQASDFGLVPNVKKLSGHPAAYWIRIGDHRLGCFLNGDVVELVRFLHRRDVYRAFP